MRRVVLATTVLLFVSFLIPHSLAHPGRTDENGGHYDSDTEEYHYHHGYPAHDHYDMDGDGDIDCPYNFVDKTGDSSGSSAGKEDYSSIYSYTDNVVSSKVIISSDDKQSPAPTSAKNESGSTWYSKFAEICIWAFLGISCILAFVCRSRGNEIKEIRSQNEALSSRVSDRNRTIAQLMDAISISEIGNSRDRFLLRYAPFGSERAGIPLEVSFTDDEKPAIGEITEDAPFGNLTVFCTGFGKCYHCVNGCSGSYLPECLLDVVPDKAPCSKCVPPNMYLTNKPDWYRNVLCIKAKAAHIRPSDMPPVTAISTKKLPEDVNQ